MVTIAMLWLPIVVSAVAVFIASSIIHMVFKWHEKDFARLPQEAAVADALRPFDIPPGDYMLPRGEGMQDMKNPEFIAKMERGPVLTMTVWKPGPPSMGKELAMWFGFCLLVSLFAAYLAGRALAPGAPYLEVFRFAGTTAFGVYALGELVNSIWYKRQWGSTARNVIDGLIYALVTAGVFGWLWPGAG